jgi:hypothetical protein
MLNDYENVDTDKGGNKLMELNEKKIIRTIDIRT